MVPGREIDQQLDLRHDELGSADDVGELVEPGRVPTHVGASAKHVERGDRVAGPAVDLGEPRSGIVVSAQRGEQGDEIAHGGQWVDTPSPLHAGHGDVHLPHRPRDATHGQSSSRLEPSHRRGVEDGRDLIQLDHRLLAVTHQELRLGERGAQHGPRE